MMESSSTDEPSLSSFSAKASVQHQVIIIGAGISGLSAARHLYKNGVTDVIILEATDKAGGRILTEKFGGRNGLIDLGAQWIHGEQNEFCQLVKASNHRNVKTSWEGKGDFLCPDASKVENSMVDEVLGWIEDSIEEVESSFSIETVQETENAITATSMGKYLQDKFDRFLRERHPECESCASPEYYLQLALFQWGMSFQRIDNSCHRMNDVSLYRWSEFEVNPGEHYNNFAMGAQSFVDEVLVGGAGDESLRPRVIYNSPVRNINWNAHPRGGVKVTTEAGTIYWGQTAIVTVSVGVLKSNLESLFTPKLPEKLSNAILSTGYGPVTKIFLEWAEPWWPTDLKGFQLVWPKEYLDCCEGSGFQENLDDSWHKTITGFDPVLDNPNVLLAWLGGPEAIYVETLPEEQVMSRCVRILKDFTGYNIPEPEKIAVSKWNTNRHFQGAYCFRSVDGDNVKGDICAVLCDPVVVTDERGENAPVIVLAGEALSKTHYSTLHGAYESGISQAAKIVQYFNSPPVTASSSSLSSCPSASATSNNNDVSKSANNVTRAYKKNESFTLSVIAANTGIEVPS